MHTIATHDGSFHSDDVFAVAAFQLLLGVTEVQVLRVDRNNPAIEAEYVVDVGGVYDHERKRYDHHQNGAPIRENGIPYAGFGLMWRHYGAIICCSEVVAEKLDQILVQPIDAPDNGMILATPVRDDVRPVELYQIVKSFAPAWGSDTSVDEAFDEAVHWAREFLTRMIKNTQAHITMDEMVRQVYEDSEEKRILVFDIAVPAEALIVYPDVEVIVTPSVQAEKVDWRATVVRQSHGSFTPRVVFPLAWAGLRDGALQVASGIADALFCHKAQFLFVAKSKESALEAARLAK